MIQKVQNEDKNREDAQYQKKESFITSQIMQNMREGRLDKSDLDVTERPMITESPNFSPIMLNPRRNQEIQLAQRAFQDPSGA